MPFGGFKQSGIGRDGGVEGLENLYRDQGDLLRLTLIRPPHRCGGPLAAGD
jgi:hypothetical protein